MIDSTDAVIVTLGCGGPNRAPTTGYWVASIGRDTVVFRSAAPVASLVLSTQVSPPTGEEFVDPAVGIAPMRLQ